MLNHGRAQLFEILSFICISVAIGKLAILPIFMEFFVQFFIELLRIYDNIYEVRKSRVEDAHQKRAKEISILCGVAVSTHLKRATAEQTAKLEAARAETRKRHSEDVAAIASLIMQQVIKTQAEEKAKGDASRLPSKSRTQSFSFTAGSINPAWRIMRRKSMSSRATKQRNAKIAIKIERERQTRKVPALQNLQRQASLQCQMMQQTLFCFQAQLTAIYSSLGLIITYDDKNKTKLGEVQKELHHIMDNVLIWSQRIKPEIFMSQDSTSIFLELVKSALS